MKLNRFDEIVLPNMIMFRFKKMFFFFLVMLFSFAVKAQITHFVYLQTENGQPFYAKLGNKIISSSSEGYVIIPNLADSTYGVEIGFPKNEYPAENFTFSIDKNNEGFLIKHFEDRGLQLFNLETLALIAPNKKVVDTAKAIAVAPEKKAPDPFSSMLANVVKDSSILQDHSVPKQQIAKPLNSGVEIKDSAVAMKDTNVAIIKDTAAIVKDSASANTSINATPAVSEGNTPAQNNNIKKLLRKQDKDGLQMMYSDTSENKTDTVRVFMPAEIEKQKMDSNAASEIKNQTISLPADTAEFTITPAAVPSVQEKGSKGYVARRDSIYNNNAPKTAPVQVFTIGPAKNNNDNIVVVSDSNEKKSPSPKSSEKERISITDVKITDVSSKNQKTDGQKTNEDNILVMPKVVTDSKVNSDCKDFASNEDFLRLRKKMAAENKMDDMLKTAKKYFRKKCYSTEQIKDLSYLFLTDEGKYMFFDAAYPFTSDSNQYEMLESQLTDEYYINRFKAMIRQ